jgi:hypothetical protein
VFPSSTTASCLPSKPRTGSDGWRGTRREGRVGRRTRPRPSRAGQDRPRLCRLVSRVRLRTRRPREGTPGLIGRSSSLLLGLFTVSIYPPHLLLRTPFLFFRLLIPRTLLPRLVRLPRTDIASLDIRLPVTCFHTFLSLFFWCYLDPRPLLLGVSLPFLEGPSSSLALSLR